MSHSLRSRSSCAVKRDFNPPLTHRIPLAYPMALIHAVYLAVTFKGSLW
jgi:hypothetical protein